MTARCSKGYFCACLHSARPLRSVLHNAMRLQQSRVLKMNDYLRAVVTVARDEQCLSCQYSPSRGRLQP